MNFNPPANVYRVGSKSNLHGTGNIMSMKSNHTIASNCGESVHNVAESEYVNSAILAFNGEINGASVDPAFIIETRKKLIDCW